MKLSPQTVEGLIHEISSVIDYDINIMDERGIIISSTNKHRIGQFHEASLLIINGGLSELAVHYDNEYKGCCKGINLPLVLNDEIIGVLGITGNVEETIQYGNIIKKTSEILLMDYYKLERQSKSEQTLMLFVNDWLTKAIPNTSIIQRRLENINFHITGKWQVAIINHTLGTEPIRDVIREKGSSTRIVMTLNNSYGIIIGNFNSSEKLGEYIEDIFTDELSGADFLFCIGNTCDNESDVPFSYDQALSALHAIKKRNEAYDDTYSGVHYYQKELFEIVIESVPQKQRSEFAASVFGACNEKDILEFIPFIRVYCECNGSINQIASKMYIHKNTVQYKIIKLQRLTGLNLRNLHDMERLHLAARWYF